MSDTEQTHKPCAIDELLEHAVSRYGSETLFEHAGTAYSYKAVDEYANIIANALYQRGIRKGDTVCLYSYNRPEYLYTLLACAKIGAVITPIDTRFTGEDLVHVITDSESSIIFVDAETESAYEEINDEVPTTLTAFSMETTESNEYVPFEELLRDTDPSVPIVETNEFDPYSLLYVRKYEQAHPQGIVLPHYSYVNTGFEASENILPLSEEDCLFTTLPFYSSYPIQIGLVGAMTVGATFSFERRFNPDTFWDSVRETGATVILYLGRMLSVLQNQSEAETSHENPAKYALGHGFGVNMDRNLITQFEETFGMTVIEAYGTTATATLATANRMDARKIGSVGKPVSYASVEIVDENDSIVPTGDTGEIVVRSNRPHAMLEKVHNDPELTAQITRNRWIHTNDIGYKDEEGFVYYVADKSNTIHLSRVAGRVSSLEIESVIESHDGVAKAVAVAVDGSTEGHEIKAVVVPEPDATVTPVEIIEHCKKELTYHKLPRYIELLDELPRTEAGQIATREIETLDHNTIWDRTQGYELTR